MAFWTRNKSKPVKQMEEPGSLEARILALESEVRLLQAEWLDVFTKFNRLAGRIERAKGHDDASSPESPIDVDAPLLPAPPPTNGEGEQQQFTRHDLLKRGF